MSTDTHTDQIIRPGSMDVDTPDANTALVIRTTAALIERMDIAHMVYIDDESNTEALANAYADVALLARDLADEADRVASAAMMDA
ncbi:hypothetical protein [Corynebacterium neomassiliense]|uniref:hypothetical protein n=1 Tax=Corynebacterium neomassiliense TaxID=2079482 RepID=UPI001031047E|nr:hypothetical protein [Corynebacterium neomassiliense]